MRIAVCFFGITRNLKKNTLHSIENCLLAEAARRDPAFKKFGHFNKTPCISNARTGEQDVPVDPDDFKLLNCDAFEQTDQAWLDEQLDFEPFKKFGDSWTDDFNSLKNFLRQLYSLNRVTEILLRSNHHFDLVIYSRADIRFEKPVQIPQIHPGTLYTPWFDKFHGLNDRFAIGDLQTMIKYGRRCSMARQYCEETGNPLHAERFLLWYAQKEKLQRRDLTTIEFSRVRANGAVVPVDMRIQAKLNYRFKRILHTLKLRPY